MTTKLIGIKKFRENITKLWKEGQKKKVRYVVMYHSKPIFEVNPIKRIKEEDVILEKLKHDIAEAREDVKHGRVYTHEQIMKEFGLN